MKMSTNSSAFHTNINEVRVLPILEVKKETSTVKSIVFEDYLCSHANPGQYAMVWIPGVDEIPLSISLMSENETCRVTVKKVGDATSALHKKTIGESIGVRGPYGSHFDLIKGKVIVVGGGTGIAPIIPLIQRLLGIGSDLTLIVGYKNSSELLFYEEAMSLLRAEGKLLVTTEDGSHGFQGFPTDLLSEEISTDSFDMVYTCGPELMMKKVFEISENIEVELQASLERYIKCSIGVCGQCVLSPLGVRVCVEGPVLNSNVLRELDDFGVFSRNSYGKKIRL
jgi:dihydroorotate dehydrogenase electron transfer subunit